MQTVILDPHELCQNKHDNASCVGGVVVVLTDPGKSINVRMANLETGLRCSRGIWVLQAETPSSICVEQKEMNSEIPGSFVLHLLALKV